MQYYRILDRYHETQAYCPVSGGRTCGAIVDQLRVICSADGLEDPAVDVNDVLVVEDPVGAFAEFAGWQHAYIGEDLFLVQQIGDVQQNGRLSILLRWAIEYNI